MAASARQRVEHMLVYFLICLCLVEIQTYRHVASSNTTNTCPDMYIKGVEAYLDENWEVCIKYFESAVKEYRRFRQNTVQCRLNCQDEASSTPPIFPYEIENLHFYETLVKKTLCLLKCKNKYFSDIPETIPKGAEKVFSELKPYEYLQLCYYQNHMPQKAASAAFTFLVQNPSNEIMLRNLQFYSKLPEVDMEQIENFEAENFVSLYIHGSDAYSKEDYESVINYIEESLEYYLSAEEECRAYCEGPFDQGWFPDYTSSIANHFTFCLRCKRKCPHKLNSLNGERHEDMLPSHYHFLQYAYYKVGNLKRACEAVESYLLFFPADETMLHNKDLYMKMPKGDKSLFIPRKEALNYVQRQEYESKLFEFIEMEFTFKEDSVDTNKESEVNSQIRLPFDDVLVENQELEPGPPNTLEDNDLLEV